MALKKWPAASKFDKAMLKELQAEYNELKNKEERTEEETLRMEALKKKGTEVNKLLKKNADKPAPETDDSPATEEPEAGDAAPAEGFVPYTEQRALLNEMIEVMSLDLEGSDVSDEDLTETIKAEGAEVVEKDFVNSDADAKVFSPNAIVLLDRLGVALPEGVEVPKPKAKGKGKKASGGSKGGKGVQRDGSKHSLAKKLFSDDADDKAWIKAFADLYPNEDEEFIKKRVKSYQSWARRQAK